MPGIEIEGLTVVDGIEKIQDCFLFKGLAFEETRVLASICKPLLAQRGDLIIEEGAPGEGLYLILDGQVKVTQGEGDTQRDLVTLGNTEIFGEMSLIEDVLTSASVTAVKETKLLKIGKRDLERLMDENHRLASKVYRAFAIVLSERLRRENRRLTLLSLMVHI